MTAERRQRLRVLHVLEAASGGTTRHLADVVRSAGGIEHHVVVPPKRHEIVDDRGAAYDDAAIAAMAHCGARIHHVDMRRTPPHPVNLVALMRLRLLIRNLRPAIVHGHSAVGGALARMVTVGTRTPVVYTPNGLATARGARALERILGRSTDRLVAVSETEAAEAKTLGLAPTVRVVVIPNGIDLSPPASETDLRQTLGLGSQTPLVGSVARLVPQKAPEELVAVFGEVARRRPDVHFLLVGLGPLQDAVDREVERNHLGDRWHQISHLPRASASLGQLDVFVLTSQFEGGPYTPLEAMRAGTPVVLTDVVGNHDTVEHGVSGILAPFGDTSALADGVVWLLDNPDGRQVMVDAASDRLRTQFDVQLMGASLAALYTELAGESRRRSTRKLPQPSASTSAQSPDASASQYSS